MPRLLRSFAGGILAASVFFTSPALASPPVFKELTFDQAKAQSVKDGKILIFDAMTSWCGPCKMMDKTSWVDADVVSWLNEHAVAIQLDMDKNKELQSYLRINAYPTIIAFKDGKEFDRIIGLKAPAAFLSWLKGVAQGESKLDQALREVKEERAKASADASNVNFEKRLELAEDLYEYGSYEESTTESAWLWETMPESSASHNDARTRLSSLMANLAKRHAPAKARFTEFRDDAAKPVKAGHPTRAELTRWLTLNTVVGDTQATVDWALKMTDTPDNLAALRSVGSAVFPLLIEGNHWATAGKTLDNPVAEIDQRGSMISAYDLPVADGADTKPKVIPAMPLMRKGEAPAAEPKADAPKTVPAIPLMRKGDNAPAAEAKKDAEPKTVPAIPLVRKGEPAPAEAKQDAQPKSIPAIPLVRKGGDAPAAASEQPLPAIPAMGAPGMFSRDDPASIAREVRYRLTLEFRDQAATYYAACLAAHRDDEAHRIAELTFKYTDTPASRLALAERALKAGQPRPEHVVWMNEIEAAGKAAAQLRTLLSDSTK
jgi:thiol-disulfide isomerase/thioredoxin